MDFVKLMMTGWLISTLSNESHYQRQNKSLKNEKGNAERTFPLLVELWFSVPQRDSCWIYKLNALVSVKT